MPDSQIADAASARKCEAMVVDLFGHKSAVVEAVEDNKFHAGNGDDGKHYWLTPPDLYAALDSEFAFTFDPCPFPKPDDFDGLTCDWGASNYVNPPFGSIIHEGKKKGPTAWARKAIAEHQQGKRVVLVYPIDKWVLMLLAAGAEVRNLGDVKWLATEDGSAGKGTGRHIACFILDQKPYGEPAMNDHRLTRNPFGKRPSDPAERDAYDWLSEHLAEAGYSVVKSLADLIRQPRCPDCGSREPCYECVAQGGPGASLLHNPEEAE